MGALDDPVVVQALDLYVALSAIDQCIEDLTPSEVQALERLSNAIGFVPRIEGPWHERVEDTGAA